MSWPTSLPEIRSLKDTQRHAKFRMARWPQHIWTTLFTYTVIFFGFPLLAFALWRWVRG